MQRFRSLLYVPAANARAIEKARTLPCDAVILDLEDSTAPEAKAAGRAAVAEALAAGFGGRLTLVRVNRLGSADCDADLDMLAYRSPGAVLFPKVASAAEAKAAVTAVTPTPAWAMIETPAAVLAASAIAASGVRGLVAGWNDLTLGAGLTLSPDRRELWAAIGMLVLAARAAGIAVLDGVPLALRDAASTRAEAAQARAFGFDGKTLVHPDQIAPTHEGFAPSPAEIAAAQALLAAWSARPPGTGVIAHGGSLVESLHAEAARRLLARAG
ncbi:MAG: CoA ester lyase [Sphingomonadaceae bacterium]|nr:CoA ester lyase [Sphingomonadaceae bacterium]